MSKLSELTDKAISGENQSIFGDVRIAGDIGGFQSTTPQMISGEDFASKITSGILGLPKSIVQETARSGGSVGLSLTGQKEMQPPKNASKLEKLTYKALFGEKPLESLGTRTEKFPKRAKEYGIPESVGKPLALPAIIGLTALDFTGLGGEKNIAKEIAKSEDVVDIAKMLIKSGTPEDLAKTYAKKLVKITDPTEVKKAFSSLEEVLKTTKKPIEAIKTEKDSLVQEAKKYKTFEEFWKSKNIIHRGDTTIIPFEKMDTVKVFDQRAKEDLIAFNNTPGLYFTTSIKNAKSYGKNITSVSIKNNANILDIDNAIKTLKRNDVEKIVRSNPNIRDQALNYAEDIDKGIKAIVDEIMSQTDGNEFLKAIWADGGFSNKDFPVAMKNFGIDGLKIKKGDVIHYVIYNKDAIKTKSQLRKIWEEAKSEKPIIPTEKFEKLRPSIIHPVKKLTNVLKESAPLTKEQKALRKIAMKQRVAKLTSIGKKTSGEKGFFAQLGQLKGELPKKDFEAIRKAFSQKEVDALFDAIETAKITPLEKITAKSGLARLFDGSLPRDSELKLFKEIFPADFIKAINDKRDFSKKLFTTIGQVLNVPRAIMASVDLSAPLRQGVFFIGRPKQFSKAFGNMFKYAFSEKAYKGLEESIKEMPTYLKMREGKLALTDLGSDLTRREESIMSNLPERIPVLGKVFRGSNRAYTGFLNKLRADVFNDIITKAGKELSNKEIKDIAKFVNSATGRGSLGELNKASTVLNSIFFSPRLIMSRLNLLNPYFYMTLSPVARKEALKSALTFGGISGTVLALAKLSGAKVETDPRNADFGKIRKGNTRYDILGGFQQPIRLISQLLSGKINSSTTGRTITLGEGYKPLTRTGILGRFFEYKTSPIASFIISAMRGTNAMGEEFDIPKEVINRFIPMVVQDFYDLQQEGVPLWEGIPAIFGTGLQTYGKQELAFGENKLGEKTAQVRQVQDLSEKIREQIFGSVPLGKSRSFNVETYFDQLSNLPREQAKDIFDKIAETNPDLAKQIVKVVKEREAGITVEDKDLKAKGVASGDRAIAIAKQLKKLKTKEEKAKLWSEYVRKGIITKKVAEQLKSLLKL